MARFFRCATEITLVATPVALGCTRTSANAADSAGAIHGAGAALTPIPLADAGSSSAAWSKMPLQFAQIPCPGGGGPCELSHAVVLPDGVMLAGCGMAEPAPRFHVKEFPVVVRLGADLSVDASAVFDSVVAGACPKGLLAHDGGYLLVIAQIEAITNPRFVDRVLLDENGQEINRLPRLFHGLRMGRAWNDGAHVYLAGQATAATGESQASIATFAADGQVAVQMLPVESPLAFCTARSTQGHLAVIIAQPGTEDTRPVVVIDEATHAKLAAPTVLSDSPGFTPYSLAPLPGGGWIVAGEDTNAAGLTSELVFRLGVAGNVERTAKLQDVVMPGFVAVAPGPGGGAWLLGSARAKPDHVDQGLIIGLDPDLRVVVHHWTGPYLVAFNAWPVGANRWLIAGRGKINGTWTNQKAAVALVNDWADVDEAAAGKCAQTGYADCDGPAPCCQPGLGCVKWDATARNAPCRREGVVD